MAWDETISRRLHDAFHGGRVEEFKTLLRANPTYLRDEDGADFWMWKAAMHGFLPIVRAVAELGVDVNETHDASNPDDPFYEPEGPVLTASGSGHVEMVRWLLESGAKINYVVQGQPRCMPLIHAAGEGHFEVVQ